MKLLSLMKALFFPKTGKHRTKQQCHHERQIWAYMKVTLQRNKNFRRTFSKIPKEGNQGNSRFSMGHCQAGSNHSQLRQLQLCQDSCWELGALGWFSLPWHAHTHEFNAMSPLCLRDFSILVFCAWEQGHRQLATQLWTLSSEMLHQKPCPLLQPVCPPHAGCMSLAM